MVAVSSRLIASKDFIAENRRGGRKIGAGNEWLNRQMRRTTTRLPAQANHTKKSPPRIGRGFPGSIRKSVRRCRDAYLRLVGRTVGLILFNDETQVCVSTACVPTLKLPYTASDRLVNVKSRILSGGTKFPFNRTGLPMASRLLSMMMGLSLKRKFFTGNLIWPFSM